jgi:ATP-dependent DNA helicase RecG
MDRDKILDTAVYEGKIRFDEQVNKEFNFKKDFDKKKLDNFLRLGNLSKTLSNKQILVNLGVMKDKKTMFFNNAGVLFFSKEPQKFIPWSVFTLVLFRDKEGADVIDRKEIDGSLFEIVDKVMDFVKLHTKVAYRFTGKPQREDVYEYPLEAVREAVINSVMHKNYFEHGHNNILKFFPDKIQIENVWIKPKDFVLEKTVFRRNSIIADLFSRIHFGEKLGSGMKRMNEYCKREKAPSPEIEFSNTYFYVVFNPSKSYLELIKEKKVTESETREKEGGQISGQISGQIMTGRQREILELIKQNPSISREELSNKLKINPSAIQKHISKLKEKGILKRIGADKGGYWEVKK